MADQEFEDILREVKQESATLRPALVPFYNEVAAHIAAGKSTRIHVTVNGTKVICNSVPPKEPSESTAAATPSTVLRVENSPLLPAFLGIVQGTASQIHVTTPSGFVLGGFPSLKRSSIDDLYPNLKRLVAAKRTARSTHIATPREVSLANPGGLYPNLTNFRFEAPTWQVKPTLGYNLLEFLRNCPRLEHLFIGYGDPRERDKTKSDLVKLGKVVSLLSLRSFTHEAYDIMLPMGILDKIDLPHTCDITLKIRGPCSRTDVKRWIWGFFPTSRFEPHRDLDKIYVIPHLSDAKRVTFTVYNEQPGWLSTVGATFSNGSHEVSLNMVVGLHHHPRLAEKLVKNILYCISKIVRSVETLHFKSHPKDPTVQFGYALEGAGRIANSQKGCAHRLKTVILSVQNMEELKGYKFCIRVLWKIHGIEVKTAEENPEEL